MKQQRLLTLQLGIIVPMLYGVHGLIHISQSGTVSNLGGLVVYGIKISYLVVIVNSILVSGTAAFRSIAARTAVLLFCVAMVPSIIAPLIFAEFVNFFYFIADFIGLLVVPLYVSVLIHYLSKSTNPIDEILRLSKLNLLSMTAVLAIYFPLSGGMKVSTPPDTAVVLSICTCALMLRIHNWTRKQIIIVAVSIALNVALTQLRAVILVVGIVALITGIRLLGTLSFKRLIYFGLGMSICGAALFYFAGDIVVDRLATLPIVGDVSVQLEDGYGDASINQRSVETEQILAQLFDHPFAFVSGMGFGAQYVNLLIEHSHYSHLQHHAHSTPIVILFRNGFISLVIYFWLLLYAVYSLFDRRPFVFCMALALFCQWMASLVDLYIYWGFPFCFSIAALVIARRIVPQHTKNYNSWTQLNAYRRLAKT